MLFMNKTLLRLARGLWLWILAIAGVSFLTLVGTTALAEIIAGFLSSLFEPQEALSSAGSAIRGALLVALFTFCAQMGKGLLEYKTAAEARTSMRRIMGNTFRAVESFTRFVKSTEYRDLPTEEEIVETSIEKGQVAEDSNDTEMSEQLTSDTTVSVDEAAKIVNDSKRDLQLSDVHQIEKDVIEEMKDIEIKHFGEKKSSVRIDITV